MLNTPCFALLGALLLTGLLTAACGNADKPAPADSEAKKEKAAADKKADEKSDPKADKKADKPKEVPSDLVMPSVKINGEPVVMKSAVAYSTGGHATHVTFSTADVKCSDFRSMGRSLAEGELFFNLTITPQMDTSGKETPKILRASFNSYTEGRASKLKESTFTSINAAKGAEGELKLMMDTPATRVLGDPARKLEVSGAFKTKGCGVLKNKRDKTLESRPQPKLKFSLVGKALPIQGATLKYREKDKSYSLALNTEPMSCERSHTDEGLQTKMTFDESGAVSFVYMGGAFLPTQLNNSSKMTFKVDKGAFKPGADAKGPVKLTLSGPKETILGYEVMIEGEVEALWCPSDKPK